MTRQELRVFLNSWQCGCGQPEQAARFLHEMLKLCPFFENREALKAKLPDDGLEYFVLYILDHLDVIEHGGGVGGAWLSEYGKSVLEALDREVGDGFDALTDQACIHGYAIEGDELLQCPECGPMNAGLKH